MSSQGSETSASNHTPPPNEESSRPRGGFGGNASPPRHPLEMNLFTPPRPEVTPVIGVPGQSAFMPYRPPTPQGPSFGPIGAPNFQGTIAFAGPSLIGGIPTGRKRGREVGVGTSGGGGGNEPAGEEEAERNMRECSVCNKRFSSAKALFGHLRSHPNRGWKGAHPPPVFKADEEFADIRMTEAEAALNEVEATEELQEENGSSFKVPDLNQPPPPDAA